MRILFAASDKSREIQLAEAFAAGTKRHGVETVICHNGALPPKLKQFDAVCMVGVKSRRIFARVERAGAIPIMLDKGYVRQRRTDSRTWEFWRVSPGAHHPTSRLMERAYPSDRFDALGLEIKPWRRRGDKIVIAGSSAKYHAFHELPDPTTYATQLVERLQMLTDLPIIYRPKPSWKDARPIEGAAFSAPPESLTWALDGAFAMVTHGSNACFEAVLWGIPCVILGDAVAAPISTTDLADLMKPKRGPREQWLANLAYFQWTEPEMASGDAWAAIREQL